MLTCLCVLPELLHRHLKSLNFTKTVLSKWALLQWFGISDEFLLYSWSCIVTKVCDFSSVLLSVIDVSETFVCIYAGYLISSAFCRHS